jgi:catechol 2,3-dioxygenase-like lactoylglutathione lyase family enzyme
MNLNRVNEIAVNVDDLDATIHFYRDTLGAKFIQMYDPPGMAFFDFSGVRLLLDKSGPKSSLYFWVDDLDAAYDELRSKGVEFRRGPMTSTGIRQVSLASPG